MFRGILSPPSELEGLMDRCFVSPSSSSSSISTSTTDLYPGYSGTVQLPQRPGFSAGSAEIGRYVQQTTDFQAIFNVIDYLNTNGSTNSSNQRTEKPGSKNKAMDEAVKYFKRKWKENSNDSIFILRTLILLECCNKNCNSEWHQYIGTQDIMQYLGYYATVNSNQNFNLVQAEIETNSHTSNSGNNVYEEVNTVSKRMIQDLANNFQNNPSYPVFYDTYLRLKMKGIIFPVLEDEGTYKNGEENIEETEKDNKSINPEKAIMDREKLKKDLETVSEQITLCLEMLTSIMLSKTSTSTEEIEKDITEESGSTNVQYGDDEEEDILIEVVAFLEACKPRMDDIIEAGMEDVNIITEPILELALEVNVELSATLEVESSRNKMKLQTLLENRDKKKAELNKVKNEKEEVEDLISLTYESQDNTSSVSDDHFGNVNQKDNSTPIEKNDNLIDLHE